MIGINVDVSDRRSCGRASDCDLVKKKHINWDHLKIERVKKVYLDILMIVSVQRVPPVGDGVGGKVGPVVGEVVGWTEGIGDGI